MKFSAASGIAIAPILFVVALLAILATAISAATGSWSSDTAQEKARTYAGAIIDYSNTVSAAVQRLMALGCSDTQISFENSTISGYTNPNAPADKHCHVFESAGGGIVWADPPQGSIGTTAWSHDSTYEFLADAVSGWGGWHSYCIGSCTQQLYMMVQVNSDIANSMKSILKQSSFITPGGSFNGSNSFVRWAGNYSAHANGLNDGGGYNLGRQGIISAWGGYYYYNVLIVR